MKAKIKFSDIAGMLAQDEMKEIIGGSGGGGGRVVAGTAFAGAGPTFQSISGNGSIFNGSSYSYFGGGSYGSSSYGGSNSYGGGTGSSYGSGITNSNTPNYGAWSNTSSGGFTTSNPAAISRLYDYLMTNSGANSTQIDNFIKNESSSAGQASNNLQLYGTALSPVTVINNYHGPSTIPQGVVINNNNNGVLQVNFGGSGSSYGGSTVSSPQQTINAKTDCVFQCLGWMSAMRGDTVHDSKYYEQMYAFLNPNQGISPLYNALTGSGGGIPQNQVVSFASKFFTATDYSGASSQFLTKFINPATNPSGNNQLMGVYRADNGNLHAVAVLRIEGTKAFFWDPQNSKEGERDMSKMINFYGITSK